jgi:diguanylate cyclase (GGDEF)-like protein
MFDVFGVLLFRNKRYLETYGFTPEEVRPGLSLQAMSMLRSKTGNQSVENRRRTRRVLKAMRDGQVLTGHNVLSDGRIIHFINTPISSGGWIVTHEDVTHQRRAEAQIEHLAGHDILTDLPNRVTLQNHLEQALRLNPRKKLVAVMFMDLDNFKGVNDTLGHPAGDELLKQVAARLQSCMRSTDLVARFGGDEFVIVSTAVAKPAEAATLATRIREMVLQPFDLLSHQVVVDISIGIALAPGHGSDVEQLLKKADLALYHAKGSGRGTYRYFADEMDVHMLERRDLERDLRDALTNNEFEIHYQPLLNLATDRIITCEALLRWNSPKRGVVSPQIFIPIAEEVGLISAIGEWVVRTACAEAANWPDDVAVAVNVSPVQFRSQKLLTIVTNALAASRIAPNRLEIEITEAVMLDHTEETLTTLRQLQALGVRIAMDDFGTGYSSLSYLQKFPFDKVKIDKSFISSLAAENESSVIVRAVTAIAGSFHMVTTAEGVETERQRALVAALGCTEMQGYLFSAARPAAEIAALLREAGTRPAARGAHPAQ